MGEPIVSVVLATYNGANRIRDAIKSVQEQSLLDWELIVIDDGSDDGTADVVKSIGDNRIKIVVNQKRLGLTRSLNVGISRSQGKYIARIDDDDVWISLAKLEEQVRVFEADPKLGVCGTQYQVIDDKGNALYQLRMPEQDAEIRKIMLRENPFGHASVCVRREALQRLGGYDEKRQYAQDYELWLRIGTEYRLCNLSMCGMSHRVSTRTVSGKHKMRQYWLFLTAAYQYRKDYPGWASNIPVYFREILVTGLMPKSWYYWAVGRCQKSGG